MEFQRSPTYTEDEVDNLLLQLECCFQRKVASKLHAVRSRAEGHKLLLAAEAVRNLLFEAVRGDRLLLCRVFGGSCRRFHRLQTILEQVGPCEVFSKDYNRITYSQDQRFLDMQNSMRSIKSVLKDLGTYRPRSPKTESCDTTTSGVPIGAEMPFSAGDEAERANGTSQSQRRC